jgi:hypothetical protein
MLKCPQKLGRSITTCRSPVLLEEKIDILAES